ncbi:MAG: hypothetical protein CSA62_10725 [Planctomycetota bacterium]|nr:MAG: hypothetical protein CSA62_10725 [Planctomycetota bacterium]
MKLFARIAVILLLAGLALGVWILSAEPEAGPHSEADPSAKNNGAPMPGAVKIPVFSSSLDCKQCHQEIYDEWMGSHHQIAYTNPEVRKLSNDFRNKECQACHLPRPILETGLAKRPLPRYDRPNEGVGCITCHMDAKQRIVGRRSRPDVGCSPIRNEKWLTTDSCKTCHNQHKTTDQWAASTYPSLNIDCSSCHMPVIQRGHGVAGRQHIFPGAHDIDTLRTAAEFRARKQGKKVIVEVENKGAGHNFPTEERHRAVDVLYRFVAQSQLEQDAPGFTRLYRFRQPYIGDPTPNTQLPAHKTWRGEISLEGQSAKGKILQLRLVYKLQPFMPDHEAKQLHEHRISIE